MTRDWQLDTYKRIDIDQIDISPLLSSLIGVPIAKNALGVVPIDYLDVDQRVKAYMLLTNLQQIYNQYLARYEEKKASELYFDFTRGQHFIKENEARNMLHDEQYSECIALCLEEIAKTKNAIHDVQRFDWAFLKCMGLFGLIGFILNTLMIFEDEHQEMFHAFKVVIILYSVISSVFSIGLLIKNYHQNYFLYAFFPSLLWANIIPNHSLLIRLIKRISAYYFAPLIACVLYFIYNFSLLIVPFSGLMAYFFYRNNIFIGTVFSSALMIFPLLDKQKDVNFILL